MGKKFDFSSIHIDGKRNLKSGRPKLIYSSCLLDRVWILCITIINIDAIVNQPPVILSKIVNL